MSGILTLISTGIFGYGMAEIYKAKVEKKDNPNTSKGVVAMFLGLLGVAVCNPVFDSFILSVVTGIVFIGFMTGFVSHTFLKTKPIENIIRAEILGPEQQNNVQVEHGNKTIEAGRMTQNSAPVAVKIFEKEILNIKNEKK